MLRGRQSCALIRICAYFANFHAAQAQMLLQPSRVNLYVMDEPSGSFAQLPMHRGAFAFDVEGSRGSVRTVQVGFDSDLLECSQGVIGPLRSCRP